jgi:hypothetical protein
MEGQRTETLNSSATPTMFVTLALLALDLVAAQLEGPQYTAVQALLTGLGCTLPLCTLLNFTANVACPNGIVCTGGRVTRLTFDSRLKLTGSIDGPSLGVLTDLQFLNLNGFPLTTIPTQIGRLAALTQLNLFDAELTGTVPSQVGNLRNLTALIVHSNQLTGTLPALEMLTKLTELDTRGNVGLVGSMPALPRSLRQLNVQACSFTALPPNLSALTALTSLYVNHNKLSGPPPVVPSSLNENGCTLQSTVGETNCFDCPPNGMFGNCRCTRNTACASVPTTTSIVSFAPTATASATMTATSAVPPTTAVVESSTASAIPATFTALTSDLISTTSITPSSGSVEPFTALTTALISITSITPSSGSVEPWMIGVIVGGAVLALLLVGVVVGCLVKRRRAQQAVATKANNAAELKQAPQSDYGQLGVSPPPSYGDVGDVQAPAKTYADVADVRGAAANVYDVIKVAAPADYDAPDSTLKF